MEKKLNRIVKKTNDYLYRYFSKEKNTDLIKPMLYGLLPGGKKIRSKILFDVGSIFKLNKKNYLASSCCSRMHSCLFTNS